ncbi:MAG TPA: TolC family protein [Bacteroidales bacterium]|nr:TolC family protein [Bacteroidales bacterium]
MKKILIILLTSCLSLGAVHAQQKWSLEDCINYAVKNNLTIKSGELTNDVQQIKLEQSKNQILPEVSGSIGSSLNFGTGLNDKNLYVQQNSQSSNMGISASMNLFSGFRIKNAIKAQEFSTLASKEELKKAKESLSVSISSAYLQVLYNKELNALAEEQVNLSQSQVGKSEILASSGKIPEGQVFEARAQLAKDTYNALECKSTLQLSLLELAQMLELKDWSNFDIQVPIIDVSSSTIVIQPADEVYNYAVSNKSDVKASEYRLKSSEKSLEITKGALYPSISIGANYSNRYYSKQRNLDSTAANLSDQLNVNGGSSIGISMSIPIFNKFDTKNNIRISKIEVEKAKVELENTRKTLYKEIQQAWFNASKATEKYKSSTEAVVNSEEAFRFAQEKYNFERATVYEFNEAKMNLATARSNQLQAKYNLLFCIKILDFYKGEPLKL